MAQIPARTLSSTPNDHLSDHGQLTLFNNSLDVISTGQYLQKSGTTFTGKTDANIATTIHLTGPDGSKPAATTNNSGYLFFSTDLDGGTLFRSTGVAWAKIAKGVTEASGGGVGSLDPAITAITHSAAGAVTLNFASTAAGFVVTASANITDILITNGPAAGEMQRRVLFVDATATITVGYASLNVVDSATPVSMVATDTFAADILVKV